MNFSTLISDFNIIILKHYFYQQTVKNKNKNKKIYFKNGTEQTIYFSTYNHFKNNVNSLCYSLFYQIHRKKQ